ncbi:MAG: hypothetical protein E7473_03705 [Ruminococcaceae bacterium]|nr:hypothetical protein [Oscillospiraceae bacterium]
MRLKKIVSTMLVICMIASLAPNMVLANEPETGNVDSIVVDFTKTTLTTNTSGNTSYDGLTTPGYEVITDKSTTKGVRVNFVGNGLNTVHDQGYSPLSSKKTWPAEKDKDTVKNLMLTINIEAETAGYYVPELVYGTHNACGDFAIYINGQYAGEITDAWDASVSAKTNMPPVTLNTVYLKAGKNEISFKCLSHRGTRVQSYLILNKLTFRYCGDSLSPIEYSHNLPKIMYIGQTASFAVSAKMSDGSTKIFGKYNEDGSEVTNPFISVSETSGIAEISDVVQDNDATTGIFSAVSEGTANINVVVNIGGKLFERTINVRIRAEQPLEYVTLDFDKDSIPESRTAIASIGVFDDEDGVFTSEYDTLFESLDPEIATVASGENKNEAVITGVSKGTARIKVTATAKGKTVGVTKEKLITVTDAPVIKELALTTNKETYKVGDEGTFELSGTMSDGVSATEEELAKVSLTYENDNEGVIALNADEKRFTALAQGDAEISAIAEVGGRRIFARRIVKVVAEGEPIVANFAKTVVGDGNVLTGATTDGFKIIEEKSSTRGARVALEGMGLQINHWISPASAGRTWPAYKDQNLMFTISVDCEKAGYYSPELIYEAYNKSGAFTIYVNDQFAGEVNAYLAGQTKGIQRTATLNTIYLDYGTNEISFRLTKSYPREDSGKYDGVWFILDKLTLSPCGETLLPKTFSHNLPERICKGQTVDFAVSTVMSDGSTKIFGKYNEDGTEITNIPITLSVTSEIGEITNWVQTATGVTGSFYVGNAGDAEITATVNVDGNTFEDTLEIKVLGAELQTTRPEISHTVFKDDIIELETVNTLTNGEAWDIPTSYTVFTSGNQEIAKIEGNTLTALDVGTVTITAKTTLAGVTKEGSVDITILDEDVKTLDITAGGSSHIRLTDIEGDTVPMYVKGITNKGAEVEFDKHNVQITYEALTPEFATIDDEGIITPVAPGEAGFRVTVLHRGREITSEVILSVAKGKSHSTYYTKEKKANALENISKYSWARSTARATVAAADNYVANLDVLYNLITSNEIPRSSTAGEYGDPEMYFCRYCGCDIQNKYGAYAWGINPIARPWKIQCPDCKRVFPSNDFESFYELGLNEYGEFSRERALIQHHKKFVCKNGENCSCAAPDMSKQTNSDGTLNKEFYNFYGYGKEGGYLYNELYKDAATSKTVNGGRGIIAENGEDVSFWGVDDSLGYLTGYRYKDSNGNIKAYERHGYIAVYAHYGLFRKATNGGGVIADAISTCFQAYLYSGEKKYGRVAAILVDRIADFYPNYDLTVFYKDRRIFVNSDGGNKNGKILGNIWETDTAKYFCEAYDAVYELYDDPEVLNFIHNKSKVLKFRHAKETPSQIRTSIEDGILRTAFEGLSDGSIAGNFGYDQRTNAMAAVVLDSQPETKEWLEFMMAPGWKRMAAGSTGGSITENLYEKIDWDGQGDEASSYNANWLDYLIDASLILADYENNEGINLFENPKFVKMFYGMLNVTMTDYGVQSGDSGSFAHNGLWLSKKQAMAAYRYIKDDVFLQALYLINGYSSDGIYENIFTKNPEQIKEDMERVIKEKGTLSLESEMLSGFGFTALRDGKRYSEEDDTRHGFWMFYGLSGAGHGHRDSLNIGMDAFGLNFLPDFGYPTTADSQPRVLQWETRTLSHNTVMVDERMQDVTQKRGKSLHFDATENVQLMDVEAPDAYRGSGVSEYRRSVIMIKIDEDNFYGLDLFRVKGGWSHEFSLHAQSDEIGFTSGVDFVPQVDENGNYKGNYAGIDLDSDPNSDSFAGPDPNSPIQGSYETVYPRGYTWLENVDRGTPTSDKIELDFNIKDFRKVLANSNGLHLRATMLGIESDSQVNTATGYVPNKPDNKSIPGIRFAFVKRKSEDKKTQLDTLFTTVYEPYRDMRTLSDISELPMTVTSGTENTDDVTRCVKVTHADGERVDYIFYATNNKVTYTVTDGEDAFTFRGFVGVITCRNGADIYKYLCDGDILDEEVSGGDAINARVTYFTESLGFENEIHIKPLYPVDENVIPTLTGRYVYVENGNVRNAAYKIESAKANGDEIILNIGDATLITAQLDPYAEDAVGNYKYNIAKRADCVIPLSWSENNAPWVEEVSDQSVSSGSILNFAIKGESPIENMGTTLSLRTAPRGASLDSETGVFTWKPSSSQVGTHVITVAVTDEQGRQSVESFEIDVYGSTTGGGTSGGGTTTPTIPATPSDEKDDTNDSTTDVEEDIILPPAESNIRFMDLGAHVWAVDAINALADKGIIKGTSKTTFSPGNNITRADFAILLVRAFGLSSENTENFADVLPTDYFADELAIARNSGIINGIGDNKFSPRNTITRQDMMVIVYRSLKSVGAIHESPVNTPEYPDYADVSDYAKEAVAALIGAGIVNGKNGKIAPDDNATRAEVAVLIKRVLDSIK